MICWIFCFRIMFISPSVWMMFFCYFLTFIIVVENFAVHLIVSAQVIDLFLAILYNPLFGYQIIGILLPFIFPCGSDGKESACNAGDVGLIPRLGIPWRRKWQPTPVFLPGEFNGQRSLAVYSPRGCKDWDTTEPLTLFFIGILLFCYHVSRCEFIFIYTVWWKFCMLSVKTFAFHQLQMLLDIHFLNIASPSILILFFWE